MQLNAIIIDDCALQISKLANRLKIATLHALDCRLSLMTIVWNPLARLGFGSNV